MTSPIDPDNADTQPPAWFPGESRILGSSQQRLEDLKFIVGQGQFVSDLVTAETLHAAFVRSTAPHGVVESIDVEAARSMPGVVEVLVAADLDIDDLAPPPGVARTEVTRPVLARDRVRYVGEPMAVVVAQTKAQADDAADLIWPDIDDLPIVNDPPTAADAAPLFQGGNVMARSTLRTERPPLMDQGDLAVSATVEVHNQRLSPLAIEGLAVLCEPQPDGRLHVTCGHQAPHRLKGQLASALKMPRADIRVVVPDVGGAFGQKGMFFTEYVVIAATARRLRRSVIWSEARREHLLAGTHGRNQTHTVTLEGDNSGRIRKATISILADVGAYPHNGVLVPTLSRFVASGLYDIDDVTVNMAIVTTNRAPTGSYRGAGRPEATFAIERAIDVFARKAGLDPAEVRRRNLIDKSKLPYETATGAQYDTGDYRAALDRALELADESGVRAEQRRRLDQGEDPIGLGIGAFIERAGGAADTGEFGDVELDHSGNVVVRTGSTSAGQGHQTVWTQAMSEVFAVSPEQVTVIAGDTDKVAKGVGTYASRSAQIGVSAAYRMALQVRDQAKELAAEMLEASAADLRIDENGFHVAGVPGITLSLADIAAHATETSVELRRHEMFMPGRQTFPYGVHIAIVEVAMETGFVELKRMVTVDDCGNVLNPMLVEGQLHGSLHQGIGQALLEGIEYSEDAIPLTATMVDYLIPTAGNAPSLVTDRLVHPAPSNPLGVKGTGEAGCIGAPPAIVNATLDALGPYGVADLQMPLHADRVWSAIQAAKRGHQ